MPTAQKLGIDILKGSFKANSNKILGSIVTKLRSVVVIGWGWDWNRPKSDIKKFSEVMEMFFT